MVLPATKWWFDTLSSNIYIFCMPALCFRSSTNQIVTIQIGLHKLQEVMHLISSLLIMVSCSSFGCARHSIFVNLMKLRGESQNGLLDVH
ncbi:hypothetical protein RchiOBHm_Chr2g0171991 [Rosa chinensis]|uniref:Uncharacterized protein n=1 Tax=Rosa chinensis TaxID=74649 RepID=A0A2P6S5G7_ROSCH|nr:hypothetical protein RchiOBHm_Chr2g0171991 [Rosa chinensis]